MAQYWSKIVKQKFLLFPQLAPWLTGGVYIATVVLACHDCLFADGDYPAVYGIKEY
jgi:hypothetical protein